MITFHRKLVWLALCIVTIATVTWRKPWWQESTTLPVAMNLSDSSSKLKVSQTTSPISPIKRSSNTIPPRSFVNTNLPAGGVLAYGFDTSETATSATPLKSYVVTLRAQKSSSGKNVIKAATYQSVSGDGVFDPKVSPKEPYLMFKQGDAYHDLGTYQLYILNQLSGVVKSVGNGIRLSNRRTLWSPDGRYIAYVEGGDTVGRFDQRISPFLKLHIFNVQTGRDKIVIDNRTIGTSFIWQSPHVLLYGAALIHKEQTATSTSDPVAESNRNTLDTAVIRPNIYSYQPESERSQLLIKDGFRPIPSPNGQWVVFFGGNKNQQNQPLMNGWESYPQSSFFYLTVARRNGTQRRSLKLESSSAYSAVEWLPDSRQFVAMTYKKTSSFGRVQIHLYNRETGSMRQIAEIGVRNFADIGIDESNPQFYTLGTSPDAKSVYLATIEFKGELQNTGLYKIIHTLYAVNIATGRATVLVKLQNPLGVNWQMSKLSGNK